MSLSDQLKNLEHLVSNAMGTALEDAERTLSNQIRKLSDTLQQRAEEQAVDRLHDAVARIDQCGDQADILSALLEESGHYASRVVLFLTFADGIKGWASYGFGDQVEALEGLVLDGDRPPFAEFLSRPQPTPLDGESCDPVCSALDGEAADGGILLPMVLRGRMAAALYADRLEARDPLVASALAMLVHSAAQRIELQGAHRTSGSPTLGVTDGALELWDPAAIVTRAADVDSEPQDEPEAELSAPTEAADSASDLDAEPSHDEIPEAGEAPEDDETPEEPDAPSDEDVAAAMATDWEEPASTEATVRISREVMESYIQQPRLEDKDEDRSEESADEIEPIDAEGVGAGDWVESDDADGTSAGEASAFVDREAFDAGREGDVGDAPRISEAEGSQAGDLEIDDLMTPEEDARDLGIEELGVPELEAQELEISDLEVQDLEVQDLEVQDLEVQDLEVQDLEVQDLDGGGSDLEVERVAVTDEPTGPLTTLEPHETSELETLTPKDLPVDLGDEDSGSDGLGAVPSVIEFDSPEPPPALADEEEPEEDTSEDKTVLLDRSTLTSPVAEPESAPETAAATPEPVPAPAAPPTPSVLSGGSTQVTPPADLDGPGWAFRQDEPAAAGEDPESAALHEEARRLARLLVSEIKLYNEEQVEEGRQSGDIYSRLRDDIDRSHQMYRDRVDPRVGDSVDYFRQELVNILAGGDDNALGM